MRRESPAEIRSAVLRHFGLLHPEATSPRIGAERSRTDAVDVTWRPHAPDEAATFVCRLCPDGCNRYSIEVNAPEPSQRMLTILREHLVSVHGIPQLSRREIRCLAEPEADEHKAIWNPALAWRGASFGCLLCPPGTIVPSVALPPYGDARRFRWLLAENPTLNQELAGLTSREQAEYVERFDRGQLTTVTATETRRKLEAARRRSARRNTRALEPPLQRIMKQRVREGQGITAVIDALLAESKEDPITFSCTIGRELGVIETEEPSGEQTANRVAAFLGYPPGARITVGESTLWKYWKSGNLA